MNNIKIIPIWVVLKNDWKYFCKAFAWSLPSLIVVSELSEAKNCTNTYYVLYYTPRIHQNRSLSGLYPWDNHTTVIETLLFEFTNLRANDGNSFSGIYIKTFFSSSFFLHAVKRKCRKLKSFHSKEEKKEIIIWRIDSHQLSNNINDETVNKSPHMTMISCLPILHWYVDTEQWAWPPIINLLIKSDKNPSIFLYNFNKTFQF